MSKANHRRWLIVVTVVAVLLLILGGMMASPPGQQWLLVNQLRRAGGRVEVWSPPKGPGWWNKFKLWVPDAFGEVHSVSLVGMPIRGGWLKSMQHWKRLEILWLQRAQVRDADLMHLNGHPSLGQVYLNNNPITDKSMSVLRLPNAWRLELNWTGVTRLDDIKVRFPRLSVLKLRGTRFSDQSVQTLVPMGHISQLDLSRTRVSDMGLEHLADVKLLQELDLRETRTTLSGVKRLHARHSSTASILASDGTGWYPVQPTHFLPALLPK